MTPPPILHFRQLSLFDLDFDLEFDTADANQLARKLQEQASLLEEEATAAAAPEDNNNPPPKGGWMIDHHLGCKA